ncbi:MAG: hypothetical protein WAW17_15840 [Rhodococcus sp. (in: high G+C Gram-positive bacteria)]|uniref:hypothetical protein n=1 Tax=Rhodococcus sp. TaxID=1831 RepID=UPI003BB0186E
MMAVYGSTYGSKDKGGGANTSNSQWGWEDWASWAANAYNTYQREHDDGRFVQIPQTPEQQAFWREIMGLVQNSPNNAGRLTGMADQIVQGYGNMETQMPGTVGVPGIPGSGGQVLYQKPNTPIDWSKIPGLDTGMPTTGTQPNNFGAAGGGASAAGGGKPGGRPQKEVFGGDSGFDDWYIRNGGTGYGYDMVTGDQPAGGIPRNDFGLPDIPGYGGEGPPEGMSYGQLSPEIRARATSIYAYIKEHGLQALNVAVASGAFGPVSPLLTGAIQFATWLYRKFGGNAPPEALQGGAPTGSAPVTPPTSGNGPLPPPA